MEKRLLQFFPTITCFAGIGFDIESTSLKPVRYLIGITYRQV